MLPKKSIQRRRIRAENVKNGLCTCGRERFEDYKVCQSCHESAVKKTAERRARAHSDKCSRCDNPAPEGVWLCSSCAAERRNKPSYIKLLMQGCEGTCYCGKPSRPGFARCPGCLESQRIRSKRLRDKRKEKGLCPGCGLQRDSKKIYCKWCLESRQKTSPTP